MSLGGEININNRVATGFSPTAPTPPIMRVRNGRFTNRNELPPISL
ncbi:MAG: hypothetical protein KZQ70_12420 [gamma proteobacterium symbiont of Lucinoma myriamae]|nr:hypothetical protein [gamma proteobacterium symbiont of Lucinoma myriamae]MCU7817432.1 hypothetical protein [gamma proteobacterium symbiont of Lucinoma myriamae]MCU7833179.1 hypothetical protein [gamma proteobacterium symbiont of Lucinoma myriamae]